MSKTFKLSPSDLTFLWDECKRCFYLKVVLGQNRPAMPFPSIFTKIDGLMKKYFDGQSTHLLTPELPPGLVVFGDRWVESLPISLPGHASQCYLRGKFDSVVQFSDGSYGVVDFKTAQAKPEFLAFYGRQLHAYAFALENPAPRTIGLAPISKLGLLVVEPADMDQTADGRIAYLGKVTWQEIPLNLTGFQAFLGEVLGVLELPAPPPAHEKCSFCQYRELARQSGL